MCERNIVGDFVREHSDSIAPLSVEEELGATKVVTWQERRSASVEEVPNPAILETAHAIIKVTSTAIGGPASHPYEVLGPCMHKGAIIGREPTGIVEEVDGVITNLRVGGRVLVLFNTACGTCSMCRMGVQSQCEATQMREHRAGHGCPGTPSCTGQFISSAT